ncbi:hypothetical protein RvY_14105 [Ramazzottius varieornatus]|uniref:Uncharacterized protein n=1 Tax=Ramazzottius varieornatus TaxID=947166 RepID=A0A1D1VS75_RAMVA|nr:hypothetical protein RvY_14105 [Ramazzottius varieornatus]
MTWRSNDQTWLEDNTSEYGLPTPGEKNVRVIEEETCSSSAAWSSSRSLPEGCYNAPNSAKRPDDAGGSGSGASLNKKHSLMSSFCPQKPVSQTGGNNEPPDRPQLPPTFNKLHLSKVNTAPRSETDTDADAEKFLQACQPTRYFADDQEPSTSSALQTAVAVVPAVPVHLPDAGQLIFDNGSYVRRDVSRITFEELRYLIREYPRPPANYRYPAVLGSEKVHARYFQASRLEAHPFLGWSYVDNGAYRTPCTP